MINSLSVAEVLKTDGGKTFTGFTSGKVYIDMQIDRAESDAVSKIGISEIAGQTIIPTIKNDSVGPTITVSGGIEDVEYGEYIKVSGAVAFDFISSVESIKVNVYAPSGEPIYSNVELGAVQPILAEEIGIYTIEYVAVDTNGNQGKYEIGVKIIDYIAPTITLSNSMPTETSVGKKFTIPSMTVVDDHTAAEDIITYVYYVSPDANTVEIKDYSFTPDQKGLYMIIYFAQDSDGATSVKYYQVRVK